MRGSHCSTSRSRVLSLLRPRTPCGLVRSCTSAIFFSDVPITMSASSSIGHQFIGAQIERIPMTRCHDADQPFHAIVDVHERAGLLAISPDFDLARFGGAMRPCGYIAAGAFSLPPS